MLHSWTEIQQSRVGLSLRGCYERIGAFVSFIRADYRSTKKAARTQKGETVISPTKYIKVKYAEECKSCQGYGYILRDVSCRQCKGTGYLAPR